MSILDRFRLDGQLALVTGCRRGIGACPAVALAEAGADIVGVSTSLGGAEEEVAQRVTAAGRRFTGYSCDFSDRQALYAWIETCEGRLADNRHSRQQMPDDSPQAGCRSIRTITGTGSRSESQRAVHFGAGDRQGHARPRAGQDYLPRVASDVSRGHQRARLCRQQGRHRPVDHGLGQRMGRPWSERQRPSPPATSRPTSTPPCVPTRNATQPILERIPSGRWASPMTCKGPQCFSPRKLPITCTGSILVVDGGWLGR